MDRALVWASGDGGVRWERLDSFRELWGDAEEAARRPRPRGVVRAVIGVPEEKYGLLAGLDPEGLAFSLDDGHIWNFIEGGPTGVRALAVNPANRAYLYAATEHGIWRSINGGNNWLESNIDLPTGRATWVSATADDLFTCVDGALYRAPQGVPIWRPVTTAPTARMTAIALDDTDRRSGVALYYGTDEGRNLPQHGWRRRLGRDRARAPARPLHRRHAGVGASRSIHPQLAAVIANRWRAGDR